MINIYCSECKKITGYLVEGSRLAKGMIHICPTCLKKVNRYEQEDMNDKSFETMFAMLFGKKGKNG